MKDRIPTYPGRVKFTPVDGQANTFDMVRADDPVQEGTPLNKATLLTDETAALFGLGEDATVNEALSIAVQSLDSLTDAVFSGCSMTTFNYTGTGTTETKTFTVGGKPLVLLVYGNNANGTNLGEDYMYVFRGQYRAAAGYNSYYDCNPVWDDTSVSFNAANSVHRGNVSNREYTVLVIFEPKQFDGEIALTITLPDGTPCSGLSVDGVYTKLGAPVSTDENGVAKGYGVNGETVSVSPPYVDLADMTFTLEGLTTDNITSVTKSFDILESVPLLTYVESGTVTLYADHEVSLSLIGGGSGGDGGYWGNGSGSNGGAGGSGGKIYNTTAALTGGVEYTIVIGAGGYGGVGGIYSSQEPISGGTGGDTTFAGFSSASGSASTLSTLNAALGGSGGQGGYGGSYDEEFDGWTIDPTDGASGTRKGGKGGTTPKTTGADGEVGKAGTRGGGGGGGSGGNYAWYYDEPETIGNGGDGGRGGSGALLIQIL